MLLENKIILITGASGGIGQMTVKRCLAEGAQVIANYRTRNKIITAWEKRFDTERILTFQADVSLEEQVLQMMKAVKEKFGHLDGIVNNAGIITRTFDWKDISIEDWHQNFDTNLIGTWNVIRYGTDLMKTGGSIVNISSIYGLFPESDALSYSISKASVDALTQVLAKKLAPQIRVNAIAPGNTLTHMVPDTQTRIGIEEKTLLKRSAVPKEIANTIIYLLSDLSTYVTGTIMPVDGGYHVI